MRQEKIPVATLRVEPYLIPLTELKDYSGSPDGLFVYRLVLNKRQFSKASYPFRATDHIFTRHINTNTPYYENSGEFWAVRQATGYVLWFGALIAYHFITKRSTWAYGKIQSPLPDRWIRIFDAQQYQHALDVAYQENQALWKAVSYPDDYTPLAELPELSPAELHGVIQHHIRSGLEDYIVYREPANDDDPRGNGLYLSLYRALKEHIGLEVCEAPRHYTELTFGIYSGRAWEWQCLVGKTEKGVAIRLRGKQARFPLWVRGPALDQAFSGEQFLNLNE